MKKLYLLLVGLFILSACQINSQEQQLIEEPIENEILYKFHEASYYKSPQKLRVFTFWVETNDTIEESIFKKIREHGAKRMHTDGQITATYYWIDKEKVKTVSPNEIPSNWMDQLHEAYPFMTVWIMANNQVNTFTYTQLRESK